MSGPPTTASSSSILAGVALTFVGMLFGWVMTILIDTQRDTRVLVDAGSDKISANDAAIRGLEARLLLLEQDVRGLSSRLEYEE